MWWPEGRKFEEAADFAEGIGTSDDGVVMLERRPRVIRELAEARH
jgi:hypothetical protein